MFWNNSQSNEPLEGSYKWCLQEKNSDESWSKYFLSRPIEEWVKILTWDCAIRMGLHIMEEAARYNVKRENLL